MWLVTGFYISFANTAIGKVRNDNDSNAAYDWSIAAEIITWVIFSLSVVGAFLFGVLFFLGGDVIIGAEALLTAGSQGKLLKGGTLFLLVVMCFLLFVTFACSVATAVNLSKSPSFDPTNENWNKGYKYSVIASILSLITLVALPFTVIIMHIFHAEKVKKNIRELQEREAVAQQKRQDAAAQRMASQGTVSSGRM